MTSHVTGCDFDCANAKSVVQIRGAIRKEARLFSIKGGPCIPHLSKFYRSSHLSRASKRGSYPYHRS